MSGELIDTTEMYLRTIYELHEEGIDPLRARIVERLKQSGPTVSQTVGRLERDGLLTVRDNRHLELSELGWKRAQEVMRKHRLAERMLFDLIGMEWVDVHDEACRLEHVISGKLEAKLAHLLNEPHESPYGCPIPSEDHRDDPTQFRSQVVSLLESVSTHAVTYRLRRMSEFVQADSDALAGLSEVGLRPGKNFEALEVGDAVEIRGTEGRVRIDRDLANGIWVDAHFVA